MPIISVIIPVYNVEKYLSACMDSVLAQTFRDFEAICVDDGSKDNSLKILNEYAQKDDRIRVVTQQNEGVSVARDAGLELAKGQYIYFMDSDDVLHPELLETVYYFAKKFDVDLVSFDFEEVRGKLPKIKHIEKEKIKYKLTDNPLFLGTTKEKYKINYNVWTKLYTKKLLEGIHFIPHISFQDYPHTFAILSKHPKTVVLDAKLYFYAIIDGSVSHRSGSVKQLNDYCKGMEFVYDIYKAPERAAELAYLKRKFIPNILKHQMVRCERADASVREEMYARFAEELRDLDSKGLIGWRGHKFSRYLKIRKLIKCGHI